MSETNNRPLNAVTLNNEEACQKAAKLYHSRMNCDRAVFEVRPEKGNKNHGC